jgi:anti-sigma factor RsiW
MSSGHPETALVPYLRGELTGGERERVARHLEQCARCRESAESFGSLLAELSSRVDELPAPEWTAYRAQLRRKLAARLERPRWWRPVQWAALGAGAALAALMVWVIAVGRPQATAPIDQFAAEPDVEIADVGLLRNYGVIQHLDLLENYDVIEHLDQLGPGAHPNHDARS